MSTPVTIGVVGDWNPASPSHMATNAALHHAASALATSVEVAWVPTSSLDGERAERALERFDGLWAAPGSPYASMVTRSLWAPCSCRNSPRPSRPRTR